MQIHAVDDQGECPSLLPPEPAKKRCFTCPQNGRNEMQLLAEFSKCSTSTDGLYHQCRACNSQLRARQKQHKYATELVTRPGTDLTTENVGAATERPNKSNVYKKLLALQNGRCGCCKEYECAKDEAQQLLRYNYYRFVSSHIEALICLRCLTMVQQTGASIIRVSHLLAFVSQGYARPTGHLVTANFE